MSLVGNERAKLTAQFLNTVAAGCLTVGIVAPAAAVVYGFGTGGSAIPARNLLLGSVVFFAVALALHFAARFVLRRLRE